MLKRLYKWLFEPCEHKWEFVNYIDYEYTSEFSSKSGTKKVYICAKCLKKKEVLL